MYPKKSSKTKRKPEEHSPFSVLPEEEAVSNKIDNQLAKMSDIYQK